MNHFCLVDVLGLDANATYKEGHARYRSLAKKHHPDKGGDAETFKLIQEAWESVKPYLPEKPLSAVPDGLVFVVDSLDPKILRRWVNFGDKGSISGSYFKWVYYVLDGDTIRVFRNELVSDSGVPLPAGVERVVPVEKAEIISHVEYTRRFVYEKV